MAKNDALRIRFSRIANLFLRILNKQIILGPK